MNRVSEPFRRFLEKRHMSLLDIPLWLFGMAVALAWFAPFVWMVSTSLKYPADVMTLFAPIRMPPAL